MTIWLVFQTTDLAPVAVIPPNSTHPSAQIGLVVNGKPIYFTRTEAAALGAELIAQAKGGI